MIVLVIDSKKESNTSKIYSLKAFIKTRLL